MAQGSALGGVGILVDYAGNDVYAGYRRVQGQALGGIGILIDREGNDRYHAAMWAQGFGGPLGFGLLDDLAGNDHYSLGGLYPNSFKPETPGYEGWGQGVALACGKSPMAASACSWTVAVTTCMSTITWRKAADTGSAWGWPATSAETTDASAELRQEFDGGKRTEPVFQRYACGWGCHYSLGFCFDDAGDDTYGGTIMGLGFAWDMSVGVLCDFAGNDRYEAARQNTQGCGAQAGLGILFDYEGNDVYLGQGQGYASPSVSYHSQSACGGNFSFLVDYGGKDEYGCGVENNSYNQRGSEGGFLIDRPSREEEANRNVPISPAVQTKKMDNHKVFGESRSHDLRQCPDVTICLALRRRGCLPILPPTWPAEAPTKNTDQMAQVTIYAQTNICYDIRIGEYGGGWAGRRLLLATACRTLTCGVAEEDYPVRSSILGARWIGAGCRQPLGSWPDRLWQQHRQYGQCSSQRIQGPSRQGIRRYGEGSGKGMAAIKQAAEAGKYIFMFFSKTDDDQTLAMRKVFDKAMEKVADRAQWIAVNMTDSSEKAIVAKFDLSRAPMPLVLAMAPNGAITGGFPTKFEEQQLVNAFATPDGKGYEAAPGRQTRIRVRPEQQDEIE